jgi:TonB family protein
MKKSSDFFNRFLFISLLLHAGLVYLTYHYYQVSEEKGEETFLVDVVDTVSGTEMDKHENKDVMQKAIHHSFPPPLLQKQFMETSVSLNAPEPRYAQYLTMVKRRIDSAWDYPEPAQKARMDGSLALQFSILRTGIINHVRLLRSSGYTQLDDEALRAIVASSPFPPLPEHLQLSRLNIMATFEYRIVYE